METGPRITSIEPVLPVSDVSAAMAFYARLGFEMVSEFLPNYAIIRRDRVRIHLRNARGELRNGECTAGVYVYVDDVQAFYEMCCEAGVRTLHGPREQRWGMLEFALNDPDGNLVRVGRVVTS